LVKRKTLSIVLALSLVTLTSASRMALAQNACTSDDTTVCTGTGTDPEPTHPNAVTTNTVVPSLYVWYIILVSALA